MCDNRVEHLPMNEPRLNLLGVYISAINMDQALEAIDGWIISRESHYICVTPAHSVMECYDHPELRPVYNASGLTTPDGMAVVWWLRWQGQRQVSRVYGPDLMLAACKQFIEKGCKHYFYGGAPGVAEKLAGRLRERFPGLRIVGMYSPPFRPLSPEEDMAASEAIVRSGADIVWVGIGSPRQEQWMSDHAGRIGAPVLIGVGAAFDFLSGCKRQAPIWVQRSGLEWLFRLVSEPGRLWRRYLLGYPRFIVLVLMQQLGLVHFD
jgi:N-acetylglucosaminyldiphosphoundecaprenol N-acetyl-beta-D-mannosaminyltransferase